MKWNWECYKFQTTGKRISGEEISERESKLGCFFIFFEAQTHNNDVILLRMNNGNALSETDGGKKRAKRHSYRKKGAGMS